MPNDATLTGPQRRAALERINENLVLRSGAGCGKTFVLARRFVRLLQAAQPDAHPLRRLVALTFTDKAAMEMAQRVRKMLRELAAGAAGPQRKALLAWLEELPEARISTIHSFCASLLRAHAVEAGLDPSFAVCADTQLTDRLLVEAADETLLAAIEAQDPPALALAARFKFSQLVEILHDLVELRGACDFADYADPAATLERWRDHVRQEADKAWDELSRDREFLKILAEVEAAQCTDKSDKLCVVRDAAVATIRGLLNSPEERTTTTIEGIATAGTSGKQGSWNVPLKEIRSLIRELIETVRGYAIYTETPGAADEAAAGLLAGLTDLAARANQRYAWAKRGRGILDFDDLIVHTQRLIAGSAQVRKAVADSIDQLLVDECQDTDSIQLSLLLPILGASETDLPAEGKLFVVGDAKQSIYRFRGAQVEVFDDLCRRLGPGRQENLDTSFRTHEAGVQFVNHLFAPLMGEDFEPISAHRQACPPGPSVEILLAASADATAIETADQATAAQADLLAERIAGMLAAGERIVWDENAKDWRAVRPGDIAVLFSRMTHSLAYERALQGRSVPYCVVGGVGFFKQQEIFDLTNALKVIDNPIDDVPLMGVLRGSLVGLDDNALMQIARDTRRPYLPSLLAAGEGACPALPEYQRRALVDTCRLLGDLHARKDAVGIDSLLEDLLAATGFEAAMMAAPQGRRIVGNVRQLVDRARTAGAQGTALADFIGEIEELIVSESRQEQAAVAGEEDDVVRIMTIHRAKGLEFPVVFLPDLNAGLRPSYDAILRRHGWPLVLKPPAAGEDGEAPLAYRVCAEAEKADAEKEDRRKFYVAATRHQDHLVLIGADWRTSEGALQGAGSFLAQVDGVLGVSEAIEAGTETLAYGKGFGIAVRRVAASRQTAGPAGGQRGQKMLAAAGDGRELAKAMAKAAPAKAGTMPLLGALPAGAYPVELAVTAMGEFAACPEMYRWHYELKAPATNIAKPQAAGRDREGRLDAATLGTLYHLCMERMDFAKPQAAGCLAREAAGEMELEVVPEGVEEELAGMVERFRGTPLWKELAGAGRLLRELDFAMQMGQVTLRGQIDVLYQGGDGQWHVVDYKSDRVGEEGVAAHAARYELQMRAYGLAAGRFVGGQGEPADAVLYFLRPGEVHWFDLAGAGPEAAGRVEALAGELIEARRSGVYGRRAAAPCRTCAYERLCRLADPCDAGAGAVHR